MLKFGSAQSVLGCLSRSNIVASVSSSERCGSGLGKSKCMGDVDEIEPGNQAIEEGERHPCERLRLTGT